MTSYTVSLRTIQKIRKCYQLQASGTAKTNNLEYPEIIISKQLKF